MIKENPVEIANFITHTRTHIYIYLSVSVYSLTSENSTIMTQSAIFRRKNGNSASGLETTSFSSTAIFRAISLCIGDGGMSRAAAHEAHPQALAPYFRILW